MGPGHDKHSKIISFQKVMQLAYQPKLVAGTPGRCHYLDSQEQWGIHEDPQAANMSL